MTRAYRTFLEEPNRAHYLKMRGAILRRKDYAPSMPELLALGELAAGKQFKLLDERASALMPTWCLSPRMHYFAALAAEGLGLAGDVQIEQFALQACLEGLQETGNGTAANPYAPTYLSDSTDLALAWGEEQAARQLVRQDGRFLELATLTDGSEHWFDVTELIARAPNIARRKSLPLVNRVPLAPHGIWRTPARAIARWN